MVVMSVSLVACRQDMHDTPRYEPLEASDAFFASGGSARTLVANTVPRGYLCLGGSGLRCPEQQRCDDSWRQAAERCANT